MKKTVIFTMMALGSLIANAQASDKLAGNEILAVQKGGVPDKVFTQDKPHLKIGSPDCAHVIEAHG